MELCGVKNLEVTRNKPGGQHRKWSHNLKKRKQCTERGSKTSPGCYRLSKTLSYHLLKKTCHPSNLSAPRGLVSTPPFGQLLCHGRSKCLKPYVVYMKYALFQSGLEWSPNHKRINIIGNYRYLIWQ